MWMAEERWDAHLCIARAAQAVRQKDVPENPYRQTRPVSEASQAVHSRRFWDRLNVALFGTTNPHGATSHGGKER